jgi:tetratricopeptide (TPR) repeat protein
MFSRLISRPIQKLFIVTDGIGSRQIIMQLRSVSTISTSNISNIPFNIYSDPSYDHIKNHPSKMVDFYKGEIEKIQQQYGMNSPQILPILSKQIPLLMDMNISNEAEKALLQYLEIYIQSEKNDVEHTLPLSLPECMGYLGLVHLSRGKHVDAQTLFKYSISLIDAQIGTRKDVEHLIKYRIQIEAHLLRSLAREKFIQKEASDDDHQMMASLHDIATQLENGKLNLAWTEVQQLIRQAIDICAGFRMYVHHDRALEILHRLEPSLRIIAKSRRNEQIKHTLGQIYRDVKCLIHLCNAEIAYFDLRFDDALSECEQIVKLHVTSVNKYIPDPTTLFHGLHLLASIHLLRGNTVTAISYLTKMMKKFPIPQPRHDRQYAYNYPAKIYFDLVLAIIYNNIGETTSAKIHLASAQDILIKYFVRLRSDVDKHQYHDISYNYLSSRSLTHQYYHLFETSHPHACFVQTAFHLVMASYDVRAGEYLQAWSTLQEVADIGHRDYLVPYLSSTMNILHTEMVLLPHQQIQTAEEILRDAIADETWSRKVEHHVNGAQISLCYAQIKHMQHETQEAIMWAKHALSLAEKPQNTTIVNKPLIARACFRLAEYLAEAEQKKLGDVYYMGDKIDSLMMRRKGEEILSTKTLNLLQYMHIL